jgi:hypothetical protein
LREEIAQLSEANRLYLHGGRKKPHGAAGDHERRPQRLQEIGRFLPSFIHPNATGVPNTPLRWCGELLKIKLRNDVRADHFIS